MVKVQADVLKKKCYVLHWQYHEHNTVAVIIYSGHV